MAAVVGDDDFDQFDKPGAERSRRKRSGDEEWDSDLDDDLLGDDLPSVKKNPSDLSDEELNDELLQSDEDDESYSSHDAAVSMNASSGMLMSLDLSRSTSSLPVTEDKDPSFGQEDTAGVYDGEEEEEGTATEETEEYAQEYYTGEEEELEGAEAELTEDQTEYAEQDEELSNDEVIELEIDETLDDEFQDEDYVHPHSTKDVLSHEVEEKNVTAFADDDQERPYEAEAGAEESHEVEDSEVAVKEESDEEDDEEESGRLRFKKERKEGTIIRIIDPTNKRRNIPETLELSEEAKAKLHEFEEKERQRKQLQIGRRREGRHGAVSCFFHGPVEGRRNNSGRGRIHDQRVPLMSVPVSQQNHPQMIPPHHSQLPPGGLFQNQQLQPLFPPQRHPRPMHHGMPAPHHIEPPRMVMPPPPSVPQQPKNIHINPHFKGPVTPPSMQVPLLPLPPEQPKLVLEPPRFPGSSEFQPHPPGPIPGNFTQVPRLPPPPPPPLEQWRGPPPPLPQDRNPPFFIGDPRFTGQQLFEQQNPPPPLLNTHPVPNQSLAAFNQPGQAFNQQGQPPLFPRERPVRPNLQPPSIIGMPHFNQPGPGSPRPFMPPRQQNPPGPVQPFPPPHIQHGMQNPIIPLQPPAHHHQQPPPHPSLQPLPLQQPPQQHHHPSQQPLLPLPRHPFRPRMQKQQQKNSNRMHRQQRQGTAKAKRQNIPSQNMSKGQNQQNQGSVIRNSNLRELPVAPFATFNCKSSATTPAAQVKPVARSVPTIKAALPAKTPLGNTEQNAKAVKCVPQPAVEVKPETEDPDEDEETRLYRLKIEEQKKLREEILKQKELRRQQQAGARKKELLERLAQQQTSVQVASQQHDSIPVMPASNNFLVPAASPVEHQNVKARLFIKKQGPGSTGLQPQNLFPVETVTQVQSQRPRKTVKQTQPIRTVPQNQLTVSQKLTQAKSPIPVLMHGLQQSAKIAAVRGRSQPLKPGMKRTVMQRANIVGGGGPYLHTNKVKLIKFTDTQMGENIFYTHSEGEHQHLQQMQMQQQVRKVTLKKGAAVQPQQQMTFVQSALPGPRNTSGTQHLPTKQVIMQGRNRAIEGQMGRGRLMSNKQNLRVVECKTESSIVAIEGISSSTTDAQLKNLLLSVGPIQSFEYLPQQRKAVARFVHSAHASAFQQKYHRHMVDLSHINVLLITE